LRLIDNKGLLLVPIIITANKGYGNKYT